MRTWEALGLVRLVPFLEGFRGLAISTRSIVWTRGLLRHARIRLSRHFSKCLV